jgi:hypothetical protein
MGLPIDIISLSPVRFSVRIIDVAQLVITQDMK